MAYIKHSTAIPVKLSDELVAAVAKNHREIMKTKKSFGKDGDLFLKKFYESFGSKTTSQKINLLKLYLGGEFNFHAMGGEVTDIMQLGCLEYEVLERAGIIKLEYR